MKYSDRLDSYRGRFDSQSVDKEQQEHRTAGGKDSVEQELHWQRGRRWREFRVIGSICDLFSTIQHYQPTEKKGAEQG